jgi:hypothetical protein
MLAVRNNPNGRPNRDIVRPWVNGLDAVRRPRGMWLDAVRRPRGMWIIDFGVDMPESEAAQYEAPFEYAVDHVKAACGRSRTTRREWWLHERPRVDMRQALAPLRRYIATPTVALHRVFVWMDRDTLLDHQLIVVAGDDDYFFGVLHSRVHDVWALLKGTSLEDRPRYTPSSTFETFPFPGRRARSPPATRAWWPWPLLHATSRRSGSAGSTPPTPPPTS